MNRGKCRACGKEIIFVATINEKEMPCVPGLVNFIPDVNGKERFLVPGGRVVRGTGIPGRATVPENVGYRPHWGECTGASRFRGAAKRAKPPKPKKPEDPAGFEPLPTWEQILKEEPAQQLMLCDPPPEE